MQAQNLNTIVEQLTEKGEYSFIDHHILHENPLPSVVQLNGIMNKLKAVLFPGFWGFSEISPNSIPYYIGANLDSVSKLLEDQIKRGFCFYCEDTKGNCKECEIKSSEKTEQFLVRLPEIKRLLVSDIIAAYNGDPAAKSFEEIIFCYPSILALTHHRVAHELYKLEVPLIPRIINEIAHSATGIDIHPGATIGENFFIDHGTGVVIGETSEIGKNVRIYQGVTLGAKSFPLDEFGMPIKNIKRHPIVEDDVIIYANATILGRVTLKKGAVVGGNAWITNDVYPNGISKEKNK